MILVPKLNPDPKDALQWPSALKPLSLKAVLQLRDGLELTQETISNCRLSGNYPKLKPYQWIALSLN